LDGVAQIIIAAIGVIATLAGTMAAVVRWQNKSWHDLLKQYELQFQQLTAARDSLQRRVSDLEAKTREVETLRALVGTLQRRIEELEQKIQQAEAEMEDRDKKIAALEAEMERLSDAKAQLEQRVGELEAENERLTVENAAYLKALQAVGAERAAHSDNTKEHEKTEETA